ncbi:hypothetical protein [Burkholderia glumae]|uniref:hypothetical protein n=1 Tax=Burkholderia glumae TaxID=337 RepID=UPI0020375FDD|nr:hypothetical protein [Burkholderia glumae]MCM2546221.1 hypothetical protein [Burkholderia glumae]UVS93460.1 hypothetical protein EFP17_28160 [Burkholderia glumae]
MSDDVTLSPVWKQAVKDFLDANFADGDVVPREWFEEHFEMGSATTAMKIDAFHARQFVWLENMESFRRELLEQHSIYLENVYGTGYRIVPPAEQTNATRERFEREIRKEFRRAAKGLKYVRRDLLTDEQRQENMDAMAKLSQVKTLRKALR